MSINTDLLGLDSQDTRKSSSLANHPGADNSSTRGLNIGLAVSQRLGFFQSRD